MFINKKEESIKYGADNELKLNSQVIMEVKQIFSSAIFYFNIKLYKILKEIGFDKCYYYKYVD